MRSRQINFFISAKDYGIINDYIIRNQIVIYGTDTSITNSIDVDTHQVFLTKKEYVENLVINFTPNGIRYFDIFKSYLLELSLGGFYPNSKNAMNRGRVYFTKSYYDNDDKICNKSVLLNDLYEEFIKFLKKNLLVRYSGDKDYLYSQSAIEWIETNEAIQTKCGQRWISEKLQNTEEK
ncbi:hypothetical protein [Flavobacterium beibuense]|uniref:hypothetical protein n=1 Tax=Flavobacterium beibuense TaxID=657326 RepID=UPI003A8F4802